MPIPMRLIPPVVVLVCSACSMSSPPPTTPSPSPSPTAAEPAAPVTVFTWPDGTAPVLTREMAGIDEAYINPGAVIEHAGMLHAFANVFTRWPGRVQVPHLISSDGIAWSLDPAAPVLDNDAIPLDATGFDVSTGLVTDDGTWVLIFETVEISDPWVLGRATAPTPAGPWTVDTEPILQPGPEGSFDAGGLGWPWVVATQDGYALYYAAYDRPGGIGVIARATSTDGVSWTKDAAPVLVAERDWEAGSLDRPRVVATPDGYVMVYAGADLTDRGVAFSEDGTTWRRDGDLPAITAEAFPIEGRAWDAALIVLGGRLIYYLEIGTAGGSDPGTQVYRAVAEL